MFRSRAFTLLELMLAIGLALIILGLSIPSMRGLFAEQRLLESFNALDEFARRAQLKAVAEQRSWVLIWQEEEILLQPDRPTADELMAGRESVTETLPFGEGVYTIKRPAALQPKPPGEWTFWRSGVCEPVVVSYEGPAGKWTARFDALTGRGEILSQTLP